jgi:hypothetical protein
MITKALEGNYVNFGVFGLYGDKVCTLCIWGRVVPRSPADVVVTSCTSLHTPPPWTYAFLLTLLGPL